MNYGLYLSSAGALVNMHRQDVLANNLANINTIGFKPDSVDLRARLPERLETPGRMTDPKLMLERLGGGLFAEPTRVSLAQGALAASSNELDLAIEGDGFFALGDGRGTTDDQLHLTRDGRLTLNERGELILAATGDRVLGTGNRPVRVDTSLPVEIAANGEVRQNGDTVGQLRIVTVNDASALRKIGDNRLGFVDGVNPATVIAGGTPGQVRQGFRETSAVDPIMTMNAMIGAAKAAQSNLKMMQYHDQLLGQTMNTFGRVV